MWRDPRKERGVRSSAGSALALSVTLALLSPALVRGYDEHFKRAELASIPFVMGSRYGRSPQHSGASDSAMLPRAERFFMGARYGKRSGPISDSDETLHGEEGGESGQSLARPLKLDGGGSEALSCEYTGVQQLHRCTSSREQTILLPQRRSEEVLSEDKLQRRSSPFRPKHL